MGNVPSLEASPTPTPPKPDGNVPAPKSITPIKIIKTECQSTPIKPEPVTSPLLKKTRQKKGGKRKRQRKQPKLNVKGKRKKRGRPPGGCGKLRDGHQKNKYQKRTETGLKLPYSELIFQG